MAEGSETAFAGVGGVFCPYDYDDPPCKTGKKINPKRANCPFCARPIQDKLTERRFEKALLNSVTEPVSTCGMCAVVGFVCIVVTKNHIWVGFRTGKRWQCSAVGALYALENSGLKCCLRCGCIERLYVVLSESWFRVRSMLPEQTMQLS